MKALLILLILLAGCVYATNGDSHINVYSKHEGVGIRIDSIWIGKTPIHNYPISSGKHTVEAINAEPGIWQNANYMAEVNIPSRRDTTIWVKFEKWVKINSIPYHAQLFYENNLMGKTPINISFQENQGKLFRLEKQGFETTEFTLSSDEPYTIKMHPLNINPAESEQSFFYSMVHNRFKLKMLLITGSVVTHWMAFALKNVADDNINKYHKTTNPAEMEKYWNETRRYDRYSEISLGVSYAFLSGLIYTVMRR